MRLNDKDPKKTLKNYLAETFWSWFEYYKIHKHVIKLENDRISRLSEYLAEECKTEKVFIFQLHPFMRSALHQRGAEDIPYLNPDGKYEQCFNEDIGSIDINSLYSKINEDIVILDKNKESKGCWYLTALGATCPLKGTLSEAAMENDVPNPKRLNLNKFDFTDSSDKDRLLELATYEIDVITWGKAGNLGIYQLPQKNEKFLCSKKEHLNIYQPSWNNNQQWEWLTYKLTEKFYDLSDIANKHSKNKVNSTEGNNEEKNLVHVPLYCLGQKAAVYVFFTENKPEKVPDVSLLYESLMMERLPYHCGHVKFGKSEEFLKDFLKGCAYIWRPTRIWANDVDNNPILGLGYAHDKWDAKLDNVTVESIPTQSELNIVIYSFEKPDDNSPFLEDGKKESLSDPLLKETYPNAIVFRGLDLPEGYRNVFPDVKYIYWELHSMDENFWNIDIEETKRIFASASMALSRGIEVLVKRLSEKQLSEERGKSEKIRELVPDWAHAFGGYLSTLKAIVSSPREYVPLMRKLQEEIDSAARATDTLVRWPSMEKWRDRHKEKHLNDLSSVNNAKRTMAFWLCLMGSIKRLIAKIFLAERKYGSALETNWNEKKDSLKKLGEEIWTGEDLCGFYKILQDLQNLNIIVELPENLENSKIPCNLLLETRTDRNIEGDFCQLINFVIDELLFNAFKNAQKFDTISPKIILCFSKDEKSSSKYYRVIISNTLQNSSKEAQHLNTPDYINERRGIGLINKICYIINGEGDRGKIFYKPEINILSAIFYIPIVSDE